MFEGNLSKPLVKSAAKTIGRDTWPHHICVTDLHQMEIVISDLQDFDHKCL